LVSYELASELLIDANLRFLAEPRLPMTELARRVGMLALALTERVRRLEGVRVIRGVRLDIDPAASCRFWKRHPSLM
jgi:Lrp/AsnC family transcriptional regulator, leucine-responsive regulatory protein